MTTDSNQEKQLTPRTLQKPWDGLSCRASIRLISAHLQNRQGVKNDLYELSVPTFPSRSSLFVLGLAGAFSLADAACGQLLLLHELDSHFRLADSRLDLVQLALG